MGRLTEKAFSWPARPWPSSVRTVTEKIHRFSGRVGASSTIRPTVPTTTWEPFSASRGVTKAVGSKVGDVLGSSGDSSESEVDYGGSSSRSSLDELIYENNASASSSSSSSELFSGILSNFSSTPVGPSSQSLFANYTNEFGINANVSTGSDGGLGATGSSRLAFGSITNLLEEDELMALWNCTNCFLLNYSGSSSSSSALINATVGSRFVNGSDRDTLLSGIEDGGVDEDAESAVYLIRVAVTSIVLGIVILATVIGEYKYSNLYSPPTVQMLSASTDVTFLRKHRQDDELQLYGKNTAENANCATLVVCLRN